MALALFFFLRIPPPPPWIVLLTENLMTPARCWKSSSRPYMCGEAPACRSPPLPREGAFFREISLSIDNKLHHSGNIKHPLKDDTCCVSKIALYSAFTLHSLDGIKGNSDVEPDSSPLPCVSLHCSTGIVFIVQDEQLYVSQQCRKL